MYRVRIFKYRRRIQRGEAIITVVAALERVYQHIGTVLKCGDKSNWEQTLAKPKPQLQSEDLLAFVHVNFGSQSAVQKALQSSAPPTTETFGTTRIGHYVASCKQSVSLKNLSYVS